MGWNAGKQSRMKGHLYVLMMGAVHMHAHKQVRAGHDKAVQQQQQAELLPSDDTACEDDVGNRDSQGHP